MDKSTKELYYESAYIREFDAEVTSCADSNSGYLIVLDQTAFFPEQGGQSSDIGVISWDGGEAKVSHTSIKKVTECECGGPITVIYHHVDREIPVGTQVHGCIDWEHRFSNMQQHTGEHIFSGIVSSKYGFDNVGFHLSDQEVTMDYNGVLSADDINDIEMLVNEAIWKNVAIRCEFPDAESLKDIPYRSKKELEGDVRIVTVEGYDICACCAPHVEKTGEIGLLKVVALQNYKGGVRVNILCGKRALRYLNSEHGIVSELAGMLTTSSDKVITQVKRAYEENARLKSELSAANEKLMEVEITAIDPELRDVYLVKEASFDSNLMRKMVNSLAESHGGLCGIFAGDKTSGYRFIICSGADNKDAKELLEKLKGSFGAKGGGSSKMIQGSLQCDDINELISSLA